MISAKKYKPETAPKPTVLKVRNKSSNNSIRLRQSKNDSSLKEQT